MGAKSIPVAAASPWENGYIEAFHSRLRDEFLERVEFETVADAREKGKWFRRYYNAVRPHSSLDYATPKEFSSSCDKRRTGHTSHNITIYIHVRSLNELPFQVDQKMGSSPFLHNSPFDTTEACVSRQASFPLPHPTSDTAELIHYACEALAHIFRPGIHYNKCGVLLTELTPDTKHQGDFLDTRDIARSKQHGDTGCH